jgi:hypothetical protein
MASREQGVLVLAQPTSRGGEAVGYHGFFHGPGSLDGSTPSGREESFLDHKAQWILGRLVPYTQPVEMAG